MDNTTAAHQAANGDRRFKVCEWDDQLLADGGHGRLIHDPTLGRARQLVKRRRWPKLTGAPRLATRIPPERSRGGCAARGSINDRLEKQKASGTTSETFPGGFNHGLE